MNRVLSLLIAFVFLHTQTWAESGGPFGSVGTSGSLTGTYAGVLIPQVAPAAGIATSIGLFTIVQADTGLATGAISVFVNGTAFVGTVTGAMDPKVGSFRGIIDAQSTSTVTIFVPVTTIVAGAAVTNFQAQNFNVGAQGSLIAQVAVDDEPNLFSTVSSSALRISGEAILDIFFQVDTTTGTPIVTQTTAFDVDGFKQSDT